MVAPPVSRAAHGDGVHQVAPRAPAGMAQEVDPVAAGPLAGLPILTNCCAVCAKAGVA